MMRGLAGLVGAIMLAAAMVVLGRAPVLAHGFAAASAQSRRSAKSGTIYKIVDEASAPDSSSDDATPSDQDIAGRRREYARAFAISAAILVIPIVIALALRH